MMQHIIKDIRSKLSPYTGSASDAPFFLPEPALRYTPPPAFHAGRLVQKIPSQNYEKLGKFVPISWL